LPPGRDVSWVTAAGHEVIVADARDGVDKIDRVVGRRLQRLIESRSFAPALSDNRLAYKVLRFPNDQAPVPSSFVLIVRDLTTGQQRTVYETPDSSGPPNWGPDGSLAVLANYGSPDNRILIIGADGGRRELQAAVPGATYLQWSRAGPLAITNFKGQSALIDPGSGRSDPLPSEWNPLCWSPDGRSLMVGQGRRLGLIGLGDLTRVKPLGSFGKPVSGCAWVGS
ncbi:MAG: hypothetical protein ACRDHK_14985, partial [Actinomycetota bacterium]